MRVRRLERRDLSSWFSSVLNGTVKREDVRCSQALPLRLCPGAASRTKVPMLWRRPVVAAAGAVQWIDVFTAPGSGASRLVPWELRARKQVSAAVLFRARRRPSPPGEVGPAGRPRGAFALPSASARVRPESGALLTQQPGRPTPATAWWCRFQSSSRCRACAAASCWKTSAFATRDSWAKPHVQSRLPGAERHS